MRFAGSLNALKNSGEGLRVSTVKGIKGSHPQLKGV